MLSFRERFWKRKNSLNNFYPSSTQVGGGFFIDNRLNYVNIDACICFIGINYSAGLVPHL